MCSVSLAYAGPYRGGVSLSLVPLGAQLWEDEYLLERVPIGLSNGVTPSLERRFGDHFAAGLELGFLWLDGGEAERRLLVRPQGRATALFPIDCRWNIVGIFGTGPTLWTEWRGVRDPERRERRWGWGFRFAFGLEFKINREVTLGLTGGLLQDSAWGDRVDGELELYPVELGLSAAF